MLHGSLSAVVKFLPFFFFYGIVMVFATYQPELDIGIHRFPPS